MGACEIDQYARQVYERHFPGVKIYHDATKIQTKNLPDFDLLCAGFPCQAFSVAGNRLGFEESRGTLFFEIARIAAEVRPRLLLLENVKGLLSHDGGKTFAVILATLDELGYDAEWQVLNSKYFVPQNRERIFIIGYLREGPRPKVFPIRETGNLDHLETPRKGEQPIISNAIDSNYWKGIDKHGQRTAIIADRTRTKQGLGRKIEERNDGLTNSLTSVQKDNYLKQVGNIDKKGHNSIWGRVYDPDGISSNINAEAGGLGAKTGLYAVPIKYLNRNQKNMPKDQAMTIDTHNSSGVTDGIGIRKLTPLECERLQGFPDGWTKGLSDTQRYRCMGNAVTVPVVEYILRRLI